MADEKNVTAFLVDFFSAIDLDSLIPIFLSNCSLALFMVLWVLSAHKILVAVAVNLKLKLSMFYVCCSHFCGLQSV